MDKLLTVLNDVENSAIKRVKSDLGKHGLTWGSDQWDITMGDTSFTVSKDKITIKSPKIEIEGETKLNGKEIMTE